MNGWAVAGGVGSGLVGYAAGGALTQNVDRDPKTNFTFSLAAAAGAMTMVPTIGVALDELDTQVARSAALARSGEAGVDGAAVSDAAAAIGRLGSGARWSALGLGLGVMGGAMVGLGPT